MALVTALVPSMLAGSAFATDLECPSLEDERHLLAESLGVTYSVDGEKVDSLRGNVSQGSTVQVEVSVPEGCDPVELTLASYESPVPKFDEGQVLFSHVTDSYPGGAVLEVQVPDCYFQLDFAYGPVIESFADDVRYGDRLIDAVNGGKNACASESPPPTGTPSTSESPSQPAESSSPTDSPTHTPSPKENSTGPTESPSPIDAPAEKPFPVQPSDEGPVGGGDDDDDDEAAAAAPRSRLASTGIPVLVLALLALLGIGTGTTLLHTTRRRRAD